MADTILDIYANTSDNEDLEGNPIEGQVLDAHDRSRLASALGPVLSHLAPNANSEAENFLTDLRNAQSKKTGRKHNDNHDERGRFSSSDSSGDGQADTVTNTNVSLGGGPLPAPLNDRDATLKKMYKNVDKKLTMYQTDALSNYVHSGYMGLNSDLRSGEAYVIGKGGLTNGQADINCITNALNENPLKQEVVTYRGVMLQNPDKSTNSFASKLMQNVGNTITDKGFGSSSIDQKKAIDFTGGNGLLMKITVPAGTPAMYIPASQAIKSLGEHELLLQKGATYQINYYNPPQYLDDYSTSPDIPATIGLTYLSGDNKLL